MKHLHILILTFAAVVFLAGCSSVAETAGTAPYTGKKIKTAFYIDKGSRGGGVIHLARLLVNSPQVEMTMVTGKDLRDGKLDKFDLIVMPGGSSQKQMESMALEGVEALRQFVQKGGSYIGICAGCHISLNRLRRARLFPYTYVQDAIGSAADVHIDITEEGGKILGVPAGRCIVRYSRGPILKEAEWTAGKCKTLAVYKSAVGPVGRPGKSFYGTPAMIYGNFGKGKLIATSFHPEYRLDSHYVFSGCFYAVTGVKLTPQLPRADFHPFRVAYHFSDTQKTDGAAAVKDVIALEKHPRLSVLPGFNAEVLSGADILVLPEAAKGFTSEKSLALVRDFMEKGGRVVAVGGAWKHLPSHANLHRLKSGSDVVSAVLSAAKE